MPNTKQNLTFSFKTYTWSLDGIELKVGEPVWIRKDHDVWIKGVFDLDRTRGYYVALVNDEVFLSQGTELERAVDGISFKRENEGHL